MSQAAECRKHEIRIERSLGSALTIRKSRDPRLVEKSNPYQGTVDQSEQLELWIRNA